MCKSSRLRDSFPRPILKTIPARASVLVAAMLASTAVAAQPGGLTRLSLRETIDLALERNADIVGATLDTRRLQGAAEGTAGILAENPVVSSEAGLRRDVGWSGSQSSFTGRIDQPLDLLGQAGSRRKAADDRVMAARSRLALMRAEIAARAHKLYLAVQVADARRALWEERLATARQTEKSLEMRVKLGASSDIDLRMARAETGRAEAALLQAKARAVAAILDMREMLRLPAGIALWPGDPLLEPPRTLPADPNSENRFAQHPSVKAIEKSRQAIESDIARLEAERLPRISVGLAAERPSSYERFLGIGLSLAPPLWRRNQGPLAEAHVLRERADFERATTLAGLERRWAAILETQALRLQQLSALDQTLGNEESVRQLVRTGWEAGKFDFIRVLLAERSVADTRQARLDLWAELWTNVIEMNRLLGKEP